MQTLFFVCRDGGGEVASRGGGNDWSRRAEVRRASRALKGELCQTPDGGNNGRQNHERAHNNEHPHDALEARDEKPARRSDSSSLHRNPHRSARMVFSVSRTNSRSRSDVTTSGKRLVVRALALSIRICKRSTIKFVERIHEGIADPLRIVSLGMREGFVDCTTFYFPQAGLRDFRG